MRADLRGIAGTVALGASVAAIGYAAFALYRLHAFGRRVGEAARVPAPNRRPPVTILKPARGDEPGLEENLASFCAQDYPAFEVVFGVLDPADPALDAIRRVAARFPQHAAVAIGDGVARYRNPKVATLEPLLAQATGEILVIADSDMRVTPDYLDAIVAPFEDPRTGAVTCIFRGEPAHGNLASTLGAMAITEQFMPSALVANAVEPMTYCFGSTIAVRRAVFDAFGGIGTLGDRLADDHAVGSLAVRHGYRVELARYVVTNVVSEPGMREMIAHELRWARTVRGVRLRSYAGIVLTYPVPLALAHLALTRNRVRAVVLLGIAVALRAAVHRTAHRVFRSERPPPAWLIPLRDVLGIVTWGLGLAGGNVRWRGTAYRMTGGGGLAAPTDIRPRAGR